MIPVDYGNKFQWIQSYADLLFLYHGIDTCRRRVIRVFPAAGFAILEKQELEHLPYSYFKRISEFIADTLSRDIL